MWTKWTQHLSDPVEKENFQRIIRAANPVLERAIQILEEKYRTFDNLEIDFKNFGSPSWSHLQAAIVGKKSEIKETIKLLTLDQKEIK